MTGQEINTHKINKNITSSDLLLQYQASQTHDLHKFHRLANFLSFQVQNTLNTL